MKPLKTEKNEGKPKTNDVVLTGLVMNLAASLKSTITKVGIASPPKWESWYKQLRAYLQAKGWLKIFDHPVGAGATDFDAEINSSIYNLLMNLCNNEKVSTYLECAAEFDGRGAGFVLVLVLVLVIVLVLVLVLVWPYSPDMMDSRSRN